MWILLLNIDPMMPAVVPAYGTSHEPYIELCSHASFQVIYVMMFGVAIWSTFQDSLSPRKWWRIPLLAMWVWLYIRT
jgi:hypothetical protein